MEASFAGTAAERGLRCHGGLPRGPPGPEEGRGQRRGCEQRLPTQSPRLCRLPRQLSSSEHALVRRRPQAELAPPLQQHQQHEHHHHRPGHAADDPPGDLAAIRGPGVRRWGGRGRRGRPRPRGAGAPTAPVSHTGFGRVRGGGGGVIARGGGGGGGR